MLRASQVTSRQALTSSEFGLEEVRATNVAVARAGSHVSGLEFASAIDVASRFARAQLLVQSEMLGALQCAC